VKVTPGKKAGGGSIGSLFKDKRVLIGLAAAGGLGLIVLLRKGNGDQSASDGTTQPQAYSSGDFDTYNAISQLGSGWTQQLQGIQDSLDQLGQAPPVGGGGPSTSPPQTKPPITTLPVPKPKPKPVTKPAPKPSAQYVKVSKFTTASAARGSNWASTLSTIAGHYHTSVSNLLKLNPSIKNANVIHTGQQIRVK
jgi:hypothetical protein